MAKSHDPRRRPLTPNLKLPQDQFHIDRPAGARGPTSPPDTPTRSPQMVRKPQHPAAACYRYSHHQLAQDPNIKPVGNGHQFSYRRVIGPEQLSPRSSSSDSSDDSEEESDAEETQGLAPSSIAESSSEDAGSESEGDASDGDVDEYEDGFGIEDDDEDEDEDDDVEAAACPGVRSSSKPGSALGSVVDPEEEDPTAPQPRAETVYASAAPLCDFVIEDMDPMDSGCEGLEVLFPTEIESNRSRSRSRHKDFDKGMVRDFKNLNCSNETSDNEAAADAELAMDNESVFNKRQKEIRRIRRVSMSSSFGKRTHSEVSDSDDSDTGMLDVNEVGSSARRMRKRLHRTSLLFQDPPAPRIDELDEPDSSEDERDTPDPLARELPYFTMEIIEMEDSS